MHMLIPTVTVIAFVGAFALNTEIGDVVIAFIFAFIGSYSFVVQLFFNDKSSSNLLICRKK